MESFIAQRFAAVAAATDAIEHGKSGEAATAAGKAAADAVAVRRVSLVAPDMFKPAAASTVSTAFTVGVAVCGLAVDGVGHQSF